MPATLVTPWSLRAWPPYCGRPASRHVCGFTTLARVSRSPVTRSPPAGQTIWAGSAAEGEAGMAWDWVLITRGVVAMADPMSVISNLRLVGDQGEVLTAQQSARFLNEIVRALPWQSEVQRALGERTH